MKVTKITTGFYKVNFNGSVYYVKNMKEHCGYWSICSSEDIGIGAEQTKKECLNWITKYL